MACCCWYHVVDNDDDYHLPKRLKVTEHYFFHKCGECQNDEGNKRWYKVFELMYGGARMNHTWVWWVSVPTTIILHYPITLPFYITLVYYLITSPCYTTLLHYSTYNLIKGSIKSVVIYCLPPSIIGGAWSWDWRVLWLTCTHDISEL